MIDWLNCNAGAVTAIATVVLVVLTGVYVTITRQIALASREQVRLHADARDAMERQDRRSLAALAKRLREAVDGLPYPAIQIGTIVQRVVLWTDDDLKDLDTLARAIEGADMAAAAQAVESLRYLGHVVEEIRTAEKGQGWNPNSIRPQDWATKIAVARTALDRLQEEPAPPRLARPT